MLFIRKNVTKAHGSATQATDISTLDQITGKLIDVSRTHIPVKALMIPLKRVKLRGVLQVNQCSTAQSLCPGIHHKNVVLGRSLISSQVKKTCQ